MVSVPLWLKSDRTRRIVCLVCFFLVEIFVLVNLVLSSDHPSSGLSWTTVDFGNTDFYFGLRNLRACDQGGSGCKTESLSIIKGAGLGGNSCVDAGGWAIASYVFVIVFTIAPLFFLLNCGCVKVPYPRLIGLLSTFIAFVFTIVAVAKWFESCHNPLECDGSCTKKAGYSVALGILTIVVDFIGMAFYFWYQLRRQNPDTLPPGKSGAIMGGSSSDSSDGYGDASPAGGQFGGYNTPGSSNAHYGMAAAALSNPQVQKWGMAAATNPQAQQFAMSAATNPQVQQWGAQQAAQSYGYSNYN